jgi:hypothetical protein
MQDTIVSAEIDRGKIVELMKLDLDTLAAITMPDAYKFSYPPFYHALYKTLTTAQSVSRDFSKFALGFPRGFAKTTWLKLIVVWLVLFSNKRFILIALATDSMAQNFISDVADMLSEPNIVAIFGDWKRTATKDTLNDKEFSFAGRKLKLTALGAGSATRGIVRNNQRPDFQIMDDIQTRESADSDLLSEKLYNWMLGTFMMTKSSYGCQHIFVGNMYPTEHCILKKLRDSPSWTSFITGCILADGTSLWEDLHPVDMLYDELSSLIDAGKDDIFMSEKMNDPTPQLKTKFDQSKLKVLGTSDDLHQGNFIIIDPSGRKKTSDSTAIGYFEIYDGKPHFVSVTNEVLTPKQTIEVALRLCSKHSCSTVVSEAVAYQESLLFWFQEALEALKINHINLIPITPKGVSKNSRILTMLKQLQAGETTVSQETKTPLLNQIYKFNPKTTANQDDLLDIVAYAPRVVNEFGHLIAIPEIDSPEYLELGVEPEHLTSAI